MTMRPLFLAFALAPMMALGCASPHPSPHAPPRQEDASTQALADTPAPEVPTLDQGPTPAAPAGPKVSSPVVALTPFFERLAQLRRQDAAQGPVHIVHLGDSHIASDTTTSELRARFQQGWGDAGRGYLQPGQPWRSYRQSGVSVAQGGKWRVEHGMSRSAQGPFGLGGVRLVSTQSGDWISRQALAAEQSFDHVEVHYLSRSGGGQVRVIVDGIEVAVFSTQPAAVQADAQPQPGEPAAQGALLGVYQLTLERPAQLLRLETVGDGEVHLLGTRAHRARAGVAYHNVGLNGARAKTFLDFDETLTRQELERLAPSLIVLGFGTNEAYNLRKTPLTQEHTKTHTAQLTALIQRYKRSAPQAACLVLLPMEFAIKPTAKRCYTRTRVRQGKRSRWVEKLIDDIDLLQHPECAWTTPSPLEMVRQANLDVARAQGCAVWDQLAAMGGPGSMRRWATLTPPLSGLDGVHLRASGYQVLGQLLYVDLMRAYERWESGQDGTLETTPWLPPEPGMSPSVSPSTTPQEPSPELETQTELETELE